MDENYTLRGTKRLAIKALILNCSLNERVIGK